MSDGYIYRNGRLCWEKLSADSYTARRDGVRYRVYFHGGAWHATADAATLGKYETLRDAIKQCQVDYADHVDWCTADES